MKNKKSDKSAIKKYSKIWSDFEYFEKKFPENKKISGVSGELNDIKFTPEYFNKQGFRYIGGPYSKEMNNRITNIRLLEKNKLPIIFSPYDLADFLRIDYFILKKIAYFRKKNKTK